MRLYKVPVGDKFRYQGHIYSVTAHEGGMVEVFGKGRLWAFPATVKTDR